LAGWLFGWFGWSVVLLVGWAGLWLGLLLLPILAFVGDLVFGFIVECC
jgi:hypothetical protein